MKNTIDTNNLMRLLWDDGIDSDVLFDSEEECSYLHVSCLGQVARVYTVWEEDDVMFLDVGDITIFVREGGRFVLSSVSGAQSAAELHQEVLELLG